MLLDLQTWRSFVTAVAPLPRERSTVPAVGAADGAVVLPLLPHPDGFCLHVKVMLSFKSTLPPLQPFPVWRVRT